MDTTYANRFNLKYMETMYAQFLEDPDSVDPSWRYFFDGVAFASQQQPSATETAAIQGHTTTVTKIQRLVRAYRKWGHLYAKLDPLGLNNKIPVKKPIDYIGFTDEEKANPVPTLGFLPEAETSLETMVTALERTYCGSIGMEYTQGRDPQRERWFQERIEPQQNQPNLDLETKRSILQRLNAAELFERFLHTKYVGQKRFSLEGAESLIPCLAELLEALGGAGAEEVVIGMPHRGRLNVLANIMGKTYAEIFTEFEDDPVHAVQGEGDVKYHKGFVSDFETRGGEKVHINLADNPSHLEAVTPVVQGQVRAHQSLRNDENRSKVVPVLIHGDASFAGQGIVSETLNMFKLEGFRTGGTIHIIVNNQIGFTTEPSDSRSTRYSSDVSRQILAPVFHVNGDDPEALVHAIRIAAAFRQRFHHDVVIDLVCYRRHGHNEGDEPSFTQPVMYGSIKPHPSTRKIYTQALLQLGDLEEKVARELEAEFNATLQSHLDSARDGNVTKSAPPVGDHYHEYRPISDEDMFRPVETQVATDTLLDLAERLGTLPEDFNINRKIKRVLDERLRQVRAGEGLDWGNAEHLAFATLVHEGIPCRLTGQDVKRGTFSHRHAGLFDSKSGSEFVPLKNLDPEQAGFKIYNSHLSELAVVGFEFGYSLAQPKCLVIWEAQFGDFVNGAQIIIDQFIVSSETKWQRVSDLVMFLPHGYEGQGPEHSSARMERFLTMCAQNNIQVANLTEPAQLFHILRRQVKRDFQKPLIIMTPKSLLRHKKCVSPLADLSNNGFREIIADNKNVPEARRLVLCSGKVYYDLQEERERRNSSDVAVARVEQLYPLKESALRDIAGQYAKLEEIVWLQEEPQNMGAWHFIEPRLRRLFADTPIRYVGREPAASPAVGSGRVHRRQQEAIINQALVIQTEVTTG